MKWMIYQMNELEQEPFDLAFDWRLRMPGFLQSFVAPVSLFDREEFIDSLKKGQNFLARDSMMRPKVLVHAEPKRGNIAEGHLLCEPQTDLAPIISTIAFARVEVLKTFDAVVCHVLARHKTLNKIMKMSGFNDTGLRAWHGVYKGRPLEIRYYTAERI